MNKPYSELAERPVEDLGRVAEAEQALKAMLASQVARALKTREQTLRSAAEATGFAAADLSRVATGRVERFTIDRLLEMLGKLDPEAELSVSFRRRPRRDAILSQLRALEPDFRKNHATSLHLFGSVARDDANANSDVDVLIDYDKDAGEFTLFDLIGIKHAIEDKVGFRAHVSTRNGLRKHLRENVERETIRVF